MKDNPFNERNYCGETGAEGTCTFNPALLAISEVIISCAKALAFYLLKFQGTKYEQPQIKMKLVEILSSVVVNADFSNKEFEYIILAMQNKISEYQKNYKTLFKNTPPGFSISLNEPSINEIIANGEKHILKNNLELPRELKDLHTIILYLIRSTCVYTKELWYFDEDVSEYIQLILEMLDKLNLPDEDFDKLKQSLKDFCQMHYKLVLSLEDKLKTLYGPFHGTSVSKDEYAGPSILVSGHNFYELEKILEATKSTGINIYTHDGLLNAHAYEKFQSYKHLKGHYQRYLQCSSSDFASFKGAVLVTNTPMEEFDSFVRGRIFTTSMFSGLGITKIKYDNLSVLINAAKSTCGFDKHVENPPLEIGYLNNKIDSILKQLKEKFDNGEIKKIFVIKIDKNSVKLKTQLEKFINSIPDNIFVFSTFDISRKNFCKIDSFYDYGILYRCTEELKHLLITDEPPITLFVSHCNIHTLSYLITLSFMGVKNIYLGDCSYFMINPVIIDSIEKFFGIKKLSALLNLPHDTMFEELYG